MTMIMAPTERSVFATFHSVRPEPLLLIRPIVEVRRCLPVNGEDSRDDTARVDSGSSDYRVLAVSVEAKRQDPLFQEILQRNMAAHHDLLLLLADG